MVIRYIIWELATVPIKSLHQIENGLLYPALNSVELMWLNTTWLQICFYYKTEISFYGQMTPNYWIYLLGLFLILVNTFFFSLYFEVSVILFLFGLVLFIFGTRLFITQNIIYLLFFLFKQYFSTLFILFFVFFSLFLLFILIFT